MIGDSIPIQYQIGGTCYAHAFTRSLYRLARITGGGENPRTFDEVLNWAIRTFGDDGASPSKVAKAFLNRKDNAPRAFPEDLDSHLLIRTINISWDSKQKNKIKKEKAGHIDIENHTIVIQPNGELPDILKDAIRQHREPLCWFSLWENQFLAFSDFNYCNSRSISPEDIPAATGTSDTANICRHAVCLYKGSGVTTFKNSWGPSWGDKGLFSVTSLKVFNEVTFLDILVKDSAPRKYLDAVQRFSDALQAIPNSVMEVVQEAITCDKSKRIGKGNDEVFEGTFKGKIAAVKFLRPRTVAEYSSLKELRYKLEFKNIVEVYGYKKTVQLVGDTAYLHIQIAMSLEPLGNLTKYLEEKKEASPLRGGRLGWKNLFNVLLDVAEALDYLLRIQFVHGDICSDNIVLSGNADRLVAKLTDFGTLSYTGTYNPSQIGAHFWWASPEVKDCMERPIAFNGQVVTHKTDIYGLGRLIQFLLPSAKAAENSESDHSFPAALQTKYRRRIYDVAGDGNCFFHAVKRQLVVNGGGVGADIDYLRNIAIGYVKEHFEMFAGFLESSSIEEYIDRMSTNGTWVDNVIILALSNALKVNITIIQDAHIDHPIEINSSENTLTLFLGHITELHYVSLESLHTEEISTDSVKLDEMPHSLSKLMNECQEKDIDRRPSADAVLGTVQQILRVESFQPSFRLESPRDQFQYFNKEQKLPPVPGSVYCDTLEDLYCKVKDCKSIKFSDFSYTLKVNLYRNLSSNPWKFGEDAKANLLKMILIDDFGLSEDGFNYELSLDSMVQVCNRILQIIQAPPVPPPSANLRNDNHFDILRRAALKDVTLSQFSEKILVDNVATEMPQTNGVPLKYAECAPEKREDLLVDILRHRLALPNWVDIPSSTGQSGSGSSDFDFDAVDPDALDSTPETSQIGLFLADDFKRVLMQCDSISQEYLISSVLSRRMAVPLLLSASTSRASYQSLIPAMHLTRTLVCEGKLACLAVDSSMMRVAVISQQSLDSIHRQSSQLIEAVFGCHSFSKGNLKHPLIEAGFGFLKQESGYESVILLHLVGVHDEALKNALYSLVDVVIVEFESEAAWKRPVLPVVTKPSPVHFIHWNSAGHSRFFERTGKKEGVSLTQISGITNDEQFLRGIQTTLQTASSARSALPLDLTGEQSLSADRVPCQRHESLALLLVKIEANNVKSSELVLDQVIRQRSEIESLLKKHLRRGIREAFVLQKSFSEQVREERAAVKCVYKVAEKTKHKSKAVSLQKGRTDLVKSSSYAVPELVKSFVGLVGVEDPNRRMSNFAFFEQLLSEKCVEVGIESPSDVVSTEHIWREMAGMYSADPQNKAFARFPHLAALHLLDGFTLEMTDGECSQVNELWLEAVTKSLTGLIERRRSKHSPKGVKMFVLSILGTQKSGKSTLLNIMFGCRLRTGVNRCTRGINIQLIRSKRPEYDYVMVLDVEGVRSPELKDDPERNNHDNRLGLFAIWSADATLILINNTNMNDVVDILSLVKYLTEKCSLQGKGLRVCSRLFFAMNRLSIGEDKKALDQTRDTLMANIDGVFLNNPSVLSEMLRDFNKEEDIFIWGNLKMAEKPPSDLPSPEYGAAIREARDRIHDYFKAASLCADSPWRPRGLTTWMEQVKRVRQEVLDLETRIHLVDAKEVEFREAVEEFIASCRQVVSKEYSSRLSDFVETFVTELDEYKKKSAERRAKAKLFPPQDVAEETAKHFGLKIKVAAETAVNQQRERFNNHFEEHEAHNRFKPEYELKWEDFLESESKGSDLRVREIVFARAYYNDKLINAKKTIHERVLALCAKSDFSIRRKWADTEKEKKFNVIFDSVADEVQRANPRISDSVSREVTTIYESCQVDISDGKVINLDGGNSSATGEEGSSGVLNAIVASIMGVFQWGSRGAKSDESLKEAMDLQRFLSSHMSEVVSFLESATMFSTDLVVEVIQKTKHALLKQRFPFKVDAHVHVTVKARMTEMLKEKQLEWEETNSVVARLEASRGALFRFFLDAVEDVDASEMILNSIKECMKQHLADAIADNLVAVVLKNLRESESVRGENGKEIIINSKIFQAEADFDLLENLNDEEKLARCLTNSKGHYRAVAKKILKRSLAKELEGANHWAINRGKIIDALKAAATKAGEIVITPPDEAASSSKRSDETAEVSRAAVFFAELKKALQWLPKIADNLYNVTAEMNSKTAASFTAESFKAIVDKVIESLPAATTEKMPVASMPPHPSRRAAAAEKQHDAILEELVKRLQSSRDPTFRARCDQCCPVCGIQCTHRDGFGHEGLHRSCHQPKGINGVRNSDTKILSADSCVVSARKNRYHVINHGKANEKRISFRAFQSHFEDWENPPYEGDAVPEPLQVRELIFATKQDLLVGLHPTAKINTAIPDNYRHELTQLRERLDFIRGNY